jgi:signal transduction histidine kinase
VPVELTVTNVAKYAQATQASVAVERSNGIATIVVSDDGVGSAEPNGGSGLVGLIDRVEALGGRLRIDSPPGRGKRITAEIPCG